MLNREGLYRDCYLAVEHYTDFERAKKYLRSEFAAECTESELADIFSEVADNMVKYAQDMQIVVYNDGEEVFNGPAGEWLADNDGCEEVKQTIIECYYNGQARGCFFSGDWEVLRRKIQ